MLKYENHIDGASRTHGCVNSRYFVILEDNTGSILNALEALLK
jgi:hypothetical protein